MKCISIKQPWAHAVVTGLKRVENRSWPMFHRGVLLIHAGRDYIRGAKYPVGETPGFDEVHFGAVIGAVLVVECVHIARPVKGLRLSDHRLLRSLKKNPWAKGPWCHIYSGAIEFVEHIEIPGRIGVFNVADDLLSKRDKKRVDLLAKSLLR